MKNFVFISPNYPENYWMFVRGLKKHGARVLCIVDTAYENLKPELKANMAECYRVNSFNNYDEMYKAVAYFAFKYGKIDWIESNNEAWLDLDARLRDDFNVNRLQRKADSGIPVQVRDEEVLQEGRRCNCALHSSQEYR